MSAFPTGRSFCSPKQGGWPRLNSEKTPFGGASLRVSGCGFRFCFWATRNSWSLLCEQAGEVARGDDARGLVTGERQQAAFVAGDEVIPVASLRQRQQEVVARVG
jgi:hypothetical protein